MEASTAESTEQYVNEHPDIKRCLRKGLINYSSLARLVVKDLGIQKKTSKEAVLIAARRMQDRLQKQAVSDKDVVDILKRSELEIHTKVAVFTVEKAAIATVLKSEASVRRKGAMFYLVEGSKSYTLIVQEEDATSIRKSVGNSLINQHKECALINVKSPKDIENVVGALAYLTGLFAEHGVNIVEMMSCWTDNIFVVKEKDVNKAFGFLRM
ncbi:MAG: hypothetical protein QF486_01525 [Candidatus Woesearchaeota archaeon]|jgi:hypothetical protein|nr:hypothetical protein [Candidatus Woesearchaeota archaeon]MDP7198273.1 hypothetical protein [Candidatus Woesearchaeota archaeon]MDP7467375.1 hypothetical protein [Candidatus Woesearchaeota archaeon]MDP7647602.1 hypothetical protein [Candidatus Woesearchaeota archaeon]|tara:strand:+ start:113 stop:748 length:636 start_codon:yes stop_codon:yes gene_type:complete